MCTCVYIYIYAYMRAYAYLLSTYLSIYLSIYQSIYLSIYLSTCTYVRTYIRAYVRTCVRAYIHTYMPTYIYIYTYTYIYIYIYIYILHIHTSVWGNAWEGNTLPGSMFQGRPPGSRVGRLPRPLEDPISRTPSQFRIPVLLWCKLWNSKVDLLLDPPRGLGMRLTFLFEGRDSLRTYRQAGVVEPSLANQEPRGVCTAEVS